MEKHTAILLVTLTVLLTFAADIANATDNVGSMTNVYDVVGTNFKWGSNEQYPVIDLFGEKFVPLFVTNGNILNVHVNKLAKLIVDSNELHTLRDGEKLDLGYGYALETKQTNIHTGEIWLEFTRDGQHIADRIISVKEDKKTWNVTLDDIQGEDGIVVMRVHINNAFLGVEDYNINDNNTNDNNIVDIKGVEIDGIWLIDFANARTLKIEDKIGDFKLKKIVKGSNLSNQGSLVFENNMGSIVTCNAIGTNYQCYSWSNQYPLINLFGEKDVPLLANNDPLWKCHVDKLAKLVLDSNEKHTLKTGDKLDLGKGYSIQVKEIDIGGKKVWLEFDKNGKYVDDQIISTGESWTCLLNNKNWTSSINHFQGDDNIPVLKVHASDVYQSGNDSLVQIDGIWLIDYANAKTLKIGDKIREWKLENIVNGTNNSNLGSLFFKNVRDSSVSCNVVGNKYKCTSWANKSYPSINFFENKYIPLLSNGESIWKCHVNKLAKLVCDSGENHTLKTCEKLDLGKGYSILVKKIDIGGKKVWLEFNKNGKYVDDQIISTGENWTCFRDKIQGEDNIPVFKVHIADVYQNGNDSIVRIDGIWLMDYANAKTFKVGDKIGNFTLEEIVSGVNKSNMGSLFFRKTSD